MKRNERLLLVVFAALLVIFASFLGIKRLKSWRTEMDEREHRLSLHQIEADALMQDASLWKQRDAWISEHQPRFESESETTQELLDFATRMAAQAGLTVESKQYQKPQDTAHHRQFGVTLVVKGKFPQVFRWIYDLQTPNSFRVVPYLKVVPDKDDPQTVLCSIQFWRWYQPATSKASAS
ncbi:hypothetical protein BH11VER1_BH11VER1_23120 [soil metagenome]